MAGDPAELAYGHALAMLGDPGLAADVAKRALRRAGRARGLVLGHARAESVAKAAQDEPVDIANLPIVMLDLPALAATLASTRPPQERAALDVRARTGGDLVALGDSLGMRATDAADKCAAIAEEWERTLDPALLAFSGAGDCEGLAAVLADAPLDTVADLLTVAPAVHAHAAECTVCTDRVRAMAPVRSFFSDAAAEVPASVREAGHRDRTKRPSTPPPPLFDPAPTGRRLLPLRVAAAVALVAALPVGYSLVSRGGGGADHSLTRVAAVTGLQLDGTPESGLRLHNVTAKPVRYTLSASVPWLRVSPAEGRVAPGESVRVITTLTGDAPEGETPAAVIVHTSSGATSSHAYTWRNERAPELATVLDGCAVDVTVVDDGDLATLDLHWRDSVDHKMNLVGANRYAAELRPDDGPITYWVTASDTRGNVARTADAVIEPGSC